MSQSDTRKILRFGEKLREVREKKGLTLKAVASQAGVSESLVSQIERGRVYPAIDTLLSLANVLDVRLQYLFEEYDRRGPVNVIRAGERRTIHEDAVVYEEVARPEEQDGKNSIESYLITIPVGDATHRGHYGHLGKEMGYIIEGKARLKYEDRDYELHSGDSVSFAAGAPHTIENIGDSLLKALWVVSPAQRFS
ncbi:MAG: helix-turn-helix transcriptional regulator [Treponema sp.]|nr:helix-turn-helix transcriptional regulator [Treponema sp.]